MSETEIVGMIQSFALKNCGQRTGLVQMLQVKLQG